MTGKAAAVLVARHQTVAAHTLAPKYLGPFASACSDLGDKYEEMAKDLRQMPVASCQYYDLEAACELCGLVALQSTGYYYTTC